MQSENFPKDFLNTDDQSVLFKEDLLGTERIGSHLNEQLDQPPMIESHLKSEPIKLEKSNQSQESKALNSAIAPEKTFMSTSTQKPNFFPKFDPLGNERMPVIPDKTHPSDRPEVVQSNEKLPLIPQKPNPSDRPPLVQSEDYAPGEIIVKLKPGLQNLDVNSVQASVNASTLAKTKTLGMQLWKLNAGDVESAIAQLNADPRIEYAEPNYKFSFDSTPNDPSFNQLWGLNNTGQTGGKSDADIDAVEAWDLETGSSSVVVGVIDSGVDYNHPDLADNIWTNQAEAAGSFGVDDDGNGYIDDIHGYDFYNNDSDPFDNLGHGTHVAGTIAAVGDNGIGVTGVNWDAQIMALKVGDPYGLSAFAAIQAIEYATQMGVKLTNNSWGGGGYSQALYDAIATAGEAGQLFIAAAGNDSSDNDFYPHYPSSYDLDNVIAVAATDHNDDLAWFSNYGATSVDLGAPGENILSTVPNSGYDTYSGTSMASPHVAGVASLLWAQDPTRSAEQVKNRLLASADPISALAGKTVSGGRLNAFRALAEAGTGTISGTKWNDLDVDGVRDVNEPGLSNWTIYLDENQNGILDREFTTFNAPNLPTKIGDGSKVLSTLEVSELSSFTADVNVNLDISHTWDEDLDVFLKSPSGKKVELFTDVGGGEDDFTNTTLDDEAETSITEGSPPFTGSYKPEGKLSDFLGEDPKGVWTLEITDDDKLDSGTLNSWSLTFTSSEPFTKTNADGDYALNNLAPGTYTVAEEFQPGWEPTYPSPDSSYNVSVQADEILKDIDFGNRDSSIGVIKGTKWQDKNADGIKDPEEPGLANWMIYLDENNNGEFDYSEQSTFTDENGEYVFVGLDAGNYIVAEELKDGWVQTFPEIPGKHEITLDPGQVKGNIDFGNYPLPAEISGSKWNDINGDRLWDETEPGLANWTIYLDANENGLLDEGESSTVTDENGNYSFTDLEPGTYHVAEVPQAGWKQTYPSSVTIFDDPMGDTFGYFGPQLDIKTVSGKVSGNNLVLTMDFFGAIAPPSSGAEEAVSGVWDLDLDQNPSTGWSYQNSYAPFDQQGGPLGDEVFIDLYSEAYHPGFVDLIDANYYTSIGTAPISYGSDSLEIQVPLDLLGDDGAINYGTIIGSIYEFTDAAPNSEVGTVGGASIQNTATTSLKTKNAIAPLSSSLKPPTAQEFSTTSLPKAEFNTASVTLPGYHTIELDPGESATNVNFGNQEILPGEIHGSKWNDADGNGVWDEGEEALPGWTIYLDANENSQLDDDEIFTVTDDYGNYSFTELDPGSYTVAEVPQDGWVQTYPTISSGYVWSDSDQVGGPTFDWVEISDVGTPISLGDDSFQEVSLPFAFSFFGEEKNSVKISSNGYLSFGEDAISYSNTGIPDPTLPNDFIAALWDDLNPGAGGMIYNHYNAAENQFIVEYSAVPPYYSEEGTYTFETILDGDDNSIFFQYLDLNVPANSATVGVENPEGSEGTQVAFDSEYLHNNLAVEIVSAEEALPAPHTVEVGSGEVVEDINFGNQQVMVPEVFIDDVTVTEGNGDYYNSAVFTVSLSEPTNEVVTVEYATADDSAISWEDYVETSGSLSFAPGETSQQIEVPIIGDTTDEADENFSIYLTNVNNAAIVDDQGIGTILDDDTSGGTPGHDLIIGTSGHDTLSGGGGNDTIDGLEGHDSLNGGADHDELMGRQGHDTLYGDTGDDLLDGGADNDVLKGGADHDTLKGAGGKDTLTGGTGDDLLNSGAGEDVLMGVHAVNQPAGRGELDTLTGGAGSDRYVLADTARGAYYNDGNTSNGGIMDFALLTTFNPSEDVIQLVGSAAEYGLSVVGSNTNIYLDDDSVAGLSSQDELIGRIVGVTGLALTDSCFVYS